MTMAERRKVCVAVAMMATTAFMCLSAVLPVVSSVPVVSSPNEVLVSSSGDYDQYRFPCGPPSPPTRFAYVTMHYEGTPADADYVLALRVLLKSLKNSGSDMDFVILASPSVTTRTINTLCHEGAVVERVKDVSNPFQKDVLPRFLLTMNKLHVWELTRYERVVYLDADNVALRNMDELFFCGSFCVVFMNPCNFHTGLMVIKPDLQEFDRLVTLLNSDAQSFDGADQGFLCFAYNTLPESPLFVNNGSAGSRDHVMRLPVQYNMHHWYYGVSNSWDEFHYHGFHSENNPFFSIAYPITPVMKPWRWLPYAFMTEKWRTWLDIRQSLDDAPPPVVVTLTVVPLILVFVVYVLGKHFVAHPPADSATSMSDHSGPLPSPLPQLAGIAAVLFGFHLGFTFIPVLLMPSTGWTLLLYFLNLTVFAVVCLFHMRVSTSDVSTLKGAALRMVIPVGFQLGAVAVVVSDTLPQVERFLVVIFSLVFTGRLLFVAVKSAASMHCPCLSMDMSGHMSPLVAAGVAWVTKLQNPTHLVSDCLGNDVTGGGGGGGGGGAAVASSRPEGESSDMPDPRLADSD